MERREFLATCAALGGAGLAGLHNAWAAAAVRSYDRVLLVDVQGAPVRARQLAPETNYVFSYPFAATPCFLLRMARAVPPAAALRRDDGVEYSFPGGVGPERSLVAYSAICAHKLAYPTREVSFIRYQRERSATAAGSVIHCCADHSVYDPAEGARVVSGPAPQPLAGIVLEHDATKDELFAVGTVGAEQFGAFFAKYDLKLTMEYGSSKARAAVGGQSVVRELAQYCRNPVAC
jgi:arsenite oxidase small subunit